MSALGNEPIELSDEELAAAQITVLRHQLTSAEQQAASYLAVTQRFQQENRVLAEQLREAQEKLAELELEGHGDGCI